MTEGEFEKRIKEIVLVDRHSFSLSALEEDILQIVEEAKKEFPDIENFDGIDMNEILHKYKRAIEKWRKKWFGK